MPLIRKDPPAPVESSPSDLRQAGARLRRGTPQERWSAARSLGLRPGAARVLGDALAVEPDARVREAIFTSLARLACPESVEAVIAQVRSDDAGLRAGAFDAMRQMIAAVRPRLPALLTDPDPDVRILCCDLVREISSSEGTELLRAVLERDPEPNVCAAAVEVLAEIGQETALPSLESCRARFPGQDFLIFAIEIAAQRIAR